MNLENDHNVYILGAGFSADAGLPLIPNFLTRMRDSHPWLIDRGRIREADAIQAVLEFRLKATAAGYWTSVDLENLEELFSLASVEGTQLLYHMRYAIAATLDFCKQTAGRKTRRLAPRGTSANDLKARFPWLGEFTNQAFEVPSYAFYMARLLGMFNNTGGNPVGQNTFITFNYDTLVEDGFHHLKVPFNYGFDPNKAKLSNSARACFDKTAIKILKLHGSINWQYQLTDAFGLQDCPTIFGDYNEINNAMVSPEIVPPTWRKVFDGALGGVWTEAIKSLHTATRIVVIGFSIPPTDTHFKFIISAGLKENISLRQILFINPDATNIKERASSIFRQEHISTRKVQFIEFRMESYLDNQDAPAAIGRPKRAEIEFDVF